jgi:hypothetical protein
MTSLVQDFHHSTTPHNHELTGDGEPPPADARSMPPTPDASLEVCFEAAVDPKSRFAINSPSFDT